MKTRNVALGVLMVCAATIGCKDHESQVRAASGESAKKIDIQVPNAPWPEKFETPELSSWNDAASLDEEIIEKLKEQANAGDARSAVIVAAFFASSKPTNRAEADKWTLIAAENGDAPSAVEVAWSLQRQGGKDSCLRAKFWLERAALAQEPIVAAATRDELSPAEVIGLFTLRDNWQACLEGNGAKYLGSPQ